jgi:signal transduction histidine kinase
MSHEIRTPLNVILSYNSFLKDELSSSLNEDIKLSFNSIDSAGKRLLRTIDMILNLAAIQKGKIDINFDPVDIIRILNTLATEFNFQAKEKNLYLNYITPSEKIIVIGDEYLITGVFQNLLSNALKYTNEGGVEIEVAGLSENKVRVNIKDTGIGISENYLPKLFLPFTQEETGYTRKFEGNGLGLALVKNYMDLLQAEIKVESEKGRGTTFSIFFNLANNAS